MKKYVKVSLTAICLVLLLSSCGGKGGSQDVEAGAGGRGMMANQNQNSSATAVETQEIKYTTIENEYMYTGEIAPSTEVSVYSSLSGKVASVNFDVGDKVSKGDVLFTMDTTDIQNSINVSRASVNSAQASVQSAETSLTYANGANTAAQIENAKNAITSAEDNLKTLEKTLETEKLNLDTAKKDYETYSELYKVGGISKEAMDNYENNYTKAQTNYDTAVLNYEKGEKTLEQAKTSYDIIANQTTEENIVKAQDSLNQAQASKATAEAQLRSSEQNLKDATVTSPISGTVLECNVTAGANLANGTTPFVIIDLNTVTIKINVSEQMINKINPGDAVRIRVSSMSDETFDGSVSTVSPGANQDGTYTVEINIPNYDNRLKSGMFAEAYFVREKSENTVVLPRSAVITKGDENYVFVVENNTAKKIDVETGIDNGDEIEIVNGIIEGMKVVTKGQTYLSDGDAVIDVTNGVPEEDLQKKPDENSDAGSDSNPPEDNRQRGGR